MDVEILSRATGTKLLPVRRGKVSLGTAAAWLCATILLGNALAIVWLWLYDGGVTAAHGASGITTSIGRVTGLISAYSALIQVILLARIPWIERAVGFDKLTVWHRLNGKICLYLVLAHVVFITIGYSLMDKVTVPSEVTRLLSGYPGMIAATVGTVLMTLVVVTSLVIVRARLPYEMWYVVHLTVYGGIALAWFHQIPTGNEFAVNATAGTYWTLLYVATLVLLIAFRVAAPAWQVWWHRLRIESVQVEAPGIVSLHIGGRHLERMHAKAGQFFLWRFLTRGRWWQAHPFSLSAVPGGGSLRITIKASGDFTRDIASIRPGTRIIAEGPFGTFTAARRSRTRAALIAGGIGITPLRALAEQIGGNAVLIYRVFRDEEIVFRSELDSLAREKGLTVFYVVGDHRDPGAKQLLSPRHLLELVPDLPTRDVFLCGPLAMMDAVSANLLEAGVTRATLYTERFAL